MALACLLTSLAHGDLVGGHRQLICGSDRAGGRGRGRGCSGRCTTRRGGRGCNGCNGYRARVVLLRERERPSPDCGAHQAAPEVVEEGMDAAIEAREARLVGGVVVRRPLEHDRLARAELELEEGVLRGQELAEAAREESASPEGRQHFGAGAAERAVPRGVAGEGGGDEGR